MPADDFSTRLAGQTEAPVPVTFFAKSDDGMHLWIDGEPVIDLWQNGGSNRAHATVEMQAGASYDIRLEYYDNRGGELPGGVATWKQRPDPYPNGALPPPVRNTLPAASLAR